MSTDNYTHQLSMIVTRARREAGDRFDRAQAARDPEYVAPRVVTAFEQLGIMARAWNDAVKKMADDFARGYNR